MLYWKEAILGPGRLFLSSHGAFIDDCGSGQVLDTSRLYLLTRWGGNEDGRVQSNNLYRVVWVSETIE